MAVVSVTHVFKERFVDRQRIRRQCSYVAHLTLWTAGKRGAEAHTEREMCVRCQCSYFWVKVEHLTLQSAGKAGKDKKDR